MPTENQPRETEKNFFQKRDLIIIGATILLTLAGVYFFNIIFHITAKDHTAVDNRISTNEMINYYNQYIDASPIPIWYDMDGRHVSGKLEGFPIATADLEEIINRNKFRGPSGQNIKPDKILFYIGQDGTSTYEGQTYGNMKLIAVGVKDSKLMIPENRDHWSDKDKSSIYDKADPCPGPGCPPRPASAHQDY